MWDASMKKARGHILLHLDKRVASEVRVLPRLMPTCTKNHPAPRAPTQPPNCEKQGDTSGNILNEAGMGGLAAFGQSDTSENALNMAKRVDTSGNALNMPKMRRLGRLESGFCGFLRSRSPVFGAEGRFLSPLSLKRAHFACRASTSASCCRPCWPT